MEPAHELLDIINKIEKASPNLKNDKYFFYRTDQPEFKYLLVNWHLYNIIKECLVRGYDDEIVWPDASITIGSMDTGYIIQTIPLLSGNPFRILEYLK
jgi:hypothetical protein